MSNITNLKCVVCDRPIEIGEPLLANKTGELAHQKCVLDRSKTIPDIVIPSVQVVSMTLDYQPPPKPVVVSTPEPCVMPPRPTVCSECGKPCIGMCPHCRKFVCQAYGYNNQFCGVKHEAKCPPAKEDRGPVKKTEPKPEMITLVVQNVKASKNGHSTPKKNGRRR